MLNYEVFRNHIICIIGSVEPPFHVFFFFFLMRLEITCFVQLDIAMTNIF